MESKYSAGLYRVAVVSLFKFTLSALPLPRQSPGSCCSVSHSIADEGGAWKARLVSRPDLTGGGDGRGKRGIETSPGSETFLRLIPMNLGTGKTRNGKRRNGK